MTKLKSPLALWSLLLGGVILMVGLMWPQTANAQCGSSASSCKNCHEVQAVDPVNNDGTSWHEAHAFGDFCEFCHAGNVQATDEAGAHTGMEAPLDNIQVSCGNCHAADLNERAEVYAVALGVEIGAGGSGGSASASGQPPAGDSPDSGSSSGSDGGPTTNITAAPPAAPAGIALDDPNVIDYVARYNETVLGIRTINWGNRILVGLIAITLTAGGGFVFWNEQRLRRRQIPVSAAIVEEQTMNYPNYPPQVVALLPRIASLSSQAQSDLYQLLENPAKAQVLLRNVVSLEPDLIKQVRTLDNESRALLLALAGSGD
ncbi:MAG: cytochrome c3 family protein [Anaerolineaceae bacterium]|nr:cytochrome c3 family protein [Anaerolineaceae bacterium]